jgi:hypothetical protein
LDNRWVTWNILTSGRVEPEPVETREAKVAMMKSAARNLFCWLVVSAISLSASSATAETWAVLSSNFESYASGLEPVLRSEASARSVTLLDLGDTHKKLDPIVRDCFTTDCLTRAAKSTNATVGIRVEMEHSGQFFDWHLTLFDLKQGKRLATEDGACEVCDNKKLATAFRTSVRNAFAKVAATSTKPPIKAPVKVPSSDSELDRDRAENTETSQKHIEPADIDRDSDTQVGDSEMSVRVTVEPKDAIISLAGLPIGDGEAELTLAQGAHELSVSREGYRGLMERILVDESSVDAMVLRIHLGLTDPPVVRATERRGWIDQLDTDKRRWSGIAALAVGAISIGTGMYLASIDGEMTCDTGLLEACPDLYDTTVPATTMVGIGAILSFGGGALLLWPDLSGHQDP